MAVAVDLEWSSADLAFLRSALTDRPLSRALRKAGATALRDARSEAGKRIRRRKRIKAAVVRRALVLRKPRGGRNMDGLEWAIDVRGDPVKLSAYPHRQTRKGVSVAVNRGARTLVLGAFVATMGSGHRGVFIRRGLARLPIRELLGSRPVDALLHAGEAEGVLARGRDSFAKTFARLLPIELAKGR
jgi:hypothetical protein